MITPKLTPSGTYVAQVRVGPQRVRLYGDTSRDVMEQYYRLTSAPTEDNPTLEDAMLRYILASETLSPNTIREYRRLYDSDAYDIIRKKKISLITTEDVRRMVSIWARRDLSSKTIKNWYSFFTSSVRMFLPGKTYAVQMPRQTKIKKKQSEKIPTADEVKILLKYAEGKSCEVPIMLAAYCGMRLGEIAALHPEDLDGEKLHIRRSIAKDFQGRISEKSPKTKAGERTIQIPTFVLNKLKIEAIPSERGIATSYVRTMAKTRMEHFKFHALRHFWASWMHLAGYQDKYIMKLGGWEDVTTLQRIYQHALPDVAEGIMEDSVHKAEKLFSSGKIDGGEV